jgi:hypothetical protein
MRNATYMKLRTPCKAAINRDAKIPLSNNSLFKFSPFAGGGIFCVKRKLFDPFFD